MLFFVFRLSGQKKKVNTAIYFPDKLDMSQYLDCPANTHVYNLVAILSHRGSSAHSGHYTATICNSNGEWYQYNDAKVEKISRDDINGKVFFSLLFFLLYFFDSLFFRFFIFFFFSFFSLNFVSFQFTHLLFTFIYFHYFLLFIRLSVFHLLLF